MIASLNIRTLSLQDYRTTWQAMQTFTNQRHEHTVDEIWLLEHHPVFTQGQNGKAEHLLNPGTIPVVETDRGGQVTYHGPGQLMMYTLIDLKRRQLNVREFVTILEQSIIRYLANYGIRAESNEKAPGVYIENKKICSIGLRIRKGCSYHGLAFNLKMDIKPFEDINPCGFRNLQMTQLSHYRKVDDIFTEGKKLITYFMENLGYTSAKYLNVLDNF